MMTKRTISLIFSILFLMILLPFSSQAKTEDAGLPESLRKSKTAGLDKGLKSTGKLKSIPLETERKTAKTGCTKTDTPPPGMKCVEGVFVEVGMPEMACGGACAGDLVCVEGICLAERGHACASNAECVSRICQQDRCA